MGILTVHEYSTITTALKELKKIELKDAATFASFNTEESQRLAELCRKNAEEADALIKKLDANILNFVKLEG